MTIETKVASDDAETTIETNDDYVEVVTERKVTADEKLAKARAEARQYRKRLETLEQERAADVAKAESDKKAALETVEKSYRDKHITSELKAYAIKANMVDLDDLAMVDRSKAAFDTDGNITNASELIEEFRTAKPHKFSSQTSVAAAMPKPKVMTDEAPDWKSMTPAEKRMRMKEIGVTKGF